jgi:hypothetical protein
LLLSNLAQAGRNAAPEGVTVPTFVSFQGRVLVSGSPYNGVGYFKFAVVNAAGNVTYWSNDGTDSSADAPSASVPLTVANGLFTVLLGDTTLDGMKAPLSASVFAAADRRLRVWFSTTGLTGSFEQFSPDYAIGAVPFALNAETLDGLDSNAFATSTHTHSGADITSGTVADAHIDPALARDSEVPGLAASAGFITRTLADARYARRSPTPQQIALLKWYTAITGTGSTFAVGARPWALAFDGVNMWVTNIWSDTVSVLRASDGYHIMTPTVGSGPNALAFDGANMWVSNADNNSVSVLRASDGVLIMTPLVGGEPTDLAFDGANMWVANNGSNNLSVLRARDGYHVMTITVGAGPSDLAFDGVNMWVANFGSDNVSVVRASDGYRVMTITVGNGPSALAFDGANMWVTNMLSDTVSVLRASDGVPIKNPTVGMDPVSIAFDGAFMWVTNSGSNTVSKR